MEDRVLRVQIWFKIPNALVSTVFSWLHGFKIIDYDAIFRSTLVYNHYQLSQQGFRKTLHLLSVANKVYSNTL